MRVRVECHAGYKADERPVRFELNDHLHTVEEVLDQWYDPQATFFKVRSDDGNIYILRHSASPQEDSWTLASFRRQEPG